MFTAQLHQNQYLPEGETIVNAIVSISCANNDNAFNQNPNTQLILGLIIDCSGSMEGEKIHHAREAVKDIIDLLPENSHFFVVAGNDRGKLIHRLSLADKRNKDEGKLAVRNLRAERGTAISTWLRCAKDQFPTGSQYTCQAILLTDGENGEDKTELDRTLTECQGRFQCEARGVGTEWKVEELRKIAHALLGEADIIQDHAGIIADFQKILKSAVKKEVPNVSIRLWTPVGSTLQFLKQVSPSINDLTQQATPNPNDPLTRDFPTGSWAKETRDFHLSIQIKEGPVGTKKLAGKVSVIVIENGKETIALDGANRPSEAKILAIWSDNEAQSAIINREVAHYTGQGELAQAIQEGLNARKDGDEEVATVKLGKAAKLAAESGNEATTKLLRKVVDIIDSEKGTVKLKRNVSDADVMTLDTRSTKTTKLSKT